MTLVALLVVAEAVLLVAGAVSALLLSDGDAAPSGVRDADLVAVGLVAFAALFAAGLGLCAWGLHQGATWARSPVLVWQVLQLAAGLPAFGGGAAWLGALVAVPAVLVIVGLFLPPVVAETGRGSVPR
ncbi:hypothetical protein [Kineococcus terrestris]|uniref:hypothetical protein n=1 Tax=Kineococcus terrestris TaxID=2044856 RepID=UPI0034DB7765